MRYFLGIDPDLHSLAAALVSEDLQKIEIVMVRVPKQELRRRQAAADMVQAIVQHAGLGKLATGAHGIAVEHPQVRASSPARFNDIARLCTVAGAAAAIAFERAWIGTPLFLPEPASWKGTIPKEIHQAWICQRLGWEFLQASDHCRPIGEPGKLVDKPTDWKHALDAIGLAIWAMGQVK